MIFMKHEKLQFTNEILIVLAIGGVENTSSVLQKKKYLFSIILGLELVQHDMIVHAVGGKSRFFSITVVVVKKFMILMDEKSIWI